MSSTTELVFELIEAQWLNYVSFEVNNAPFQWKLQYRRKDNQFVDIYDVTGQIVSGQSTSLATYVDVETEISKSLVTYESIVNFEEYAAEFPAIYTNAIRVEIIEPSQTIEATVRNVSVQLRIDQTGQFPQNLGVDPFSQPIVTSTLGYRESVTRRDFSSESLLSGGLWSSGPQPTADAVVPLYFDTRDRFGRSQIIDRLELGTVDSGCTFNLYYSNDLSESDFCVLSRETIEPTESERPDTYETVEFYQFQPSEEFEYEFGVPTLQNRGLSHREGESGKVFVKYSPQAYNTRTTSLKLSDNWTIGIAVHRRNQDDRPSTNLTKYWSIVNENNTRRVELYYDESTSTLKVIEAYLTVGFTDRVLLEELYELEEDVRYAIVVSHVSDNTNDPSIGLGTYLTIGRCRTNEVESFRNADSVLYDLFDFVEVQTIIAGAEVASFENPNYESIMWDAISHLWIRKDLYSLSVSQSFQSDPELFGSMSGIKTRSRGDYNCVFYSRLQDSTYKARIGLDASFYENKTWVPVTRNFILRSGVYEFPRISASYMKIEFSNLIPKPYDTGELVPTRSASYFPEWVEGWFRQIRKIEPVPIDRDVYYWPTDEYDVLMNPELDRVPSIKFKQFYTTSRHLYEVRQVPVVEKFQYFVSLYSVKFYREHYPTQYDEYAGLSERTYTQSEFTDNFLDTSLIDSTSLRYDIVNKLLYATGVSQSFTSKSFFSATKMKAIQLAVSGSQWLSRYSESQLIFDDTGHLEFDPVFMRVLDGQPLDVAGKVIEVFDQTSYESDSVELRTSLNTYTFPAQRDPDSYDGEGIYDEPADIYDSVPNYRVRLSAVLRLYLPDSNSCSYTLQLLGKNTDSTETVLSQKFLPVLSTNKWHEFVLEYSSDQVYEDFSVKILQERNSLPSGQRLERFFVGELSLYHNAFLWQVSHDEGSSWTDIPVGVNDMNSYVMLPEPSNQISIRAIASDTKGTISEYLIVPWYELANSSTKTSIISEPGISQSEYSRQSVSLKPLFQLSSTPLARR